MNLPTAITFLRILLIPVLLLVYFFPNHNRYGLASLIFLLACLTDWLDGYLARYLQQISKFGAFLDPVADKLIVVVALILIVEDKHLQFVSIPAAIIIGREIAISALREWMAEIGKRSSVAVNRFGKVKTAFQMLSLFLLLAYDPNQDYLLGVVGYSLLVLAALMTMGSMFFYMRIAWNEYKI